jgi:hypothetical protein
VSGIGEVVGLSVVCTGGFFVCGVDCCCAVVGSGATIFLVGLVLTLGIGGVVFVVDDGDDVKVIFPTEVENSVLLVPVE